MPAPTTILFDWASLAAGKDRALKRITNAFARAGQNVIASDVGPVRRSSGVSYREVAFTVASGQQAVVRVKETGDVYQALVEGQLVPIKDQHDSLKAIAEIAGYLDKNESKYQKKLAAKKVELPKTIRTAAPKIEVALQQQITVLDGQIAEATVTRDALKAELEGAPAMDAAAIIEPPRGPNDEPAAPVVTESGDDAARAIAEEVIKEDEKESEGDPLEGRPAVINPPAPADEGDTSTHQGAYFLN